MDLKLILMLSAIALISPSTAFASSDHQLLSSKQPLENQADNLLIASQPEVNSVADSNNLSCPGQSTSKPGVSKPESSQSSSATTTASSPPKQVTKPEFSQSSLATTTSSSEKVIIRHIEVSKKFKIEEIDNRIDDIRKRCIEKDVKVTPERIAAIKDAITLLYIEYGYITSRAVEEPSNQSISSDGVVKFRIIEGQIESLKICDYNEQNIEYYNDNDRCDRTRQNANYYDKVNRGYNLKYVRDRIQLGISKPFNVRKLQEQVRLLELDPLFDENSTFEKCKQQNNQTCSRKIDAILRPSANGEDGKSELIIKIPPTKFFRANLSFDNSAPPSIGAERLKTDVSFANLAGLGDNLVASLQVDPLHFSGKEDLRFAGLSYQLPLNSMNGTIQLRVERRRERIIQKPFDQFNLRAKAELYEVVYRQPLVRSYTNEFALSLGLAVQNGQTFIFNDTPFPFGIGPDKDGISRTSVLKFGQDYIHRGVTGTWLLQSQFNLGTGLFGATSNRGSIPDGRFISWLGQVQRLQQIGEAHLLIVQADLQLSPNSLLPSQQFVIGGSQSLRGYRQNVRFGDNGFRFSLEDRITLSRDQNREPIFQLTPFIDVGTVLNRSDNPNKLPPQKFLLGTGLGLLWQPLPKLNLRLEYAFPLVDLRDRGQNLQDKGIYFSINYQI